MYSLLITYFLLAIIASFLCSLWEAVLLSVTPSYAHVKVAEGSRIGDQLAAFKQNIDRPLAAILTLNTIAHTVGAIGVGEQAVHIWADSNPLITGLLVPVLMTLGILIFSEIVPKTIGANYWQELAPFTVRGISFIIVALYPLVWLSQKITVKLKKDKDASVFSRSDFAVMAEIGAKSGVFEMSEARIIKSLLRFRSVLARAVMTPRTVVHTASEDCSIRDYYERHQSLRFSRIPIYAGKRREEITGYVRKDDILRALIDGRGDELLADVRRKIQVVPETVPITSLFNLFRDSREHIALLVDEFGGMEGIVTLEDVIETLLGMEIVDELDVDADMQEVARQIWDKRARQLGLIETPEGKKTSD